METFIAAKDLVFDPDFARRREDHRRRLDGSAIDRPIRGIIEAFNRLSHCFTLQCCFGHFVWGAQRDIHNLERLPAETIPGPIDYRIAYIALCVENSEPGRRLIATLVSLADRNPGYIQFGSAEWFWERCVNSFAVQVEPERFKTCDQITVDYREVMELQAARDWFFPEIERVVAHLQPNG